jgi:hypothetical protein
MGLAVHLFGSKTELDARKTTLGKAVAKAEGSRLLAARRNGLLEASQLKLDEAREALRAGEITAGDSASEDLPDLEPLREAVRKLEEEVRLRTEAKARQDEIARVTGSRWRTLHRCIEWSSTRTPLRT